MKHRTSFVKSIAQTIRTKLAEMSFPAHDETRSDREIARLKGWLKENQLDKAAMTHAPSVRDALAQLEIARDARAFRRSMTTQQAVESSPSDDQENDPYLKALFG